MTVRILAVADSESFLKWAATTLDQVAADGTDVDSRVVVIQGPLEPSPEQHRAALAGTGVTEAPVASRRTLARLVRDHQPDVVLVAATGPVAEMIALTVLKASGDRRPALLSGPPGMALSAGSTVGVKWRFGWCDAFIVHSPREVDLFAEAFKRHGAHPRMVLTRLPFLARLGEIEPVTTPVRRIVFAPQPIVPHRRSDRLALLRGLARLHEQGFEVVVKVRTRAGERQTHYEALPFESLWRREHARMGLPADGLEFAAGPMSDWLTPGTALVTVSSTAALESLALGLPTALVADLGVSEDLANEVYVESGCMVRLDELGSTLARGGPVPNGRWLGENYLHETPSELGTAVSQLAAARRAGMLPPVASAQPLSRAISLYSQLKSDVPLLWYPAVWVRALLGRHRPLA
ncbi:DUF6716 putative glycosyltransferase [Xylanimonas sp. McL0601]|uniref:DUF6716 putative glycosyltransferase n=1 Tax=Xylanimonas sp. McL0601 TaxID=3414739 RepID=UPI003CF81E2B